MVNFLHSMASLLLAPAIPESPSRSRAHRRA